MRRKNERSKQGQTNKQGKATQHTQGICTHIICSLYVCMCIIIVQYELLLHFDQWLLQTYQVIMLYKNINSNGKLCNHNIITENVVVFCLADPLDKIKSKIIALLEHNYNYVLLWHTLEHYYAICNNYDNNTDDWLILL